MLPSKPTFQLQSIHAKAKGDCNVPLTPLQIFLLPLNLNFLTYTHKVNVLLVGFFSSP
jgi:hypothetical protein